jgi:hypothetical protein
VRRISWVLIVGCEYLEKMKKGEKNLDEVVGMSVVSFMVDKHPNIVEDGGCFQQLFILIL